MTTPDATSWEGKTLPHSAFVIKTTAEGTRFRLHRRRKEAFYSHARAALLIAAETRREVFFIFEGTEVSTNNGSTAGGLLEWYHRTLSPERYGEWERG